MTNNGGKRATNTILVDKEAGKKLATKKLQRPQMLPAHDVVFVGSAENSVETDEENGVSYEKPDPKPREAEKKYNRAQ